MTETPHVQHSWHASDTHGVKVRKQKLSNSNYPRPPCALKVKALGGPFALHHLVDAYRCQHTTWLQHEAVDASVASTCGDIQRVGPELGQDSPEEGIPLRSGT